MDGRRPAGSASRGTRQRYTVMCRCGNRMRVKMKHFGRMCRCTRCEFPIYVTYDNVDPPVKPHDREVPRVFKEDEIPVHWQKGDLLMELYEVRDTLGEGGMGVVYHVYHRGWGKHLAVKCPSPKLLDDQDWLDQFEHECNTWINISPHPNVVECYYVRRLAGIPRVFAEYVDGLDLSRMVEDKTLYTGGRLETKKRMLDVAIQFCRGLHHAHQEGVVHQDVKPHNLLIAEDTRCKVTDFGLARVWVFDDGSRRSSGSRPSGRGSGGDAASLRGMSGGTPTYSSHDQKRFGEVTYKTDMWSWGVSMIEMFSGDIYWTDGGDARNVLDNLLTHGSRYDTIPRMHKGFEDLLKRCFRDNPSERPEDMLSMARELEAIYEEETGTPYPRVVEAADETSFDVLNNRAVSMLDLGKAAEAHEIWAEILRTQPEATQVLYNKNLHHWKTGHITDAQMVEGMRHVCEQHAGDWLPVYLLARVLIERGDAEEALKVLEGALQDPANQREVAYGLAMAQNHLSRDKKLLWECNPDSINVTAVSLSFDGWHALTGGDDGQIRIWEVASRNCAAVLNGHSARVHSVCLSDEERAVLSASADGTLRVWDATTSKCLATFEGHKGQVLSGVFTPNAKHVLSGSEDGTMLLWDAKTGQPVRMFVGHQAGVNSVAVSRCGNYAFSASSDGTLRQWDIWSGRRLRSFQAKAGRVTSLCVNEPGNLMLSACGKYIQLWSIATGALLRTIQGHSSEIFSVCLNETGELALSATGMGTIKVWNIRTGQCLRSLQGHAPLALGRDAHLAISGGKQGDFKIWAVNIDEPPFPAQYILSQADVAEEN